MTSHEKKRVLESDLQTLTEEFLEVREEQLHAADLAKWRELEARAVRLLDVIGSKQLAIAVLFPQHAPPAPQGMGTKQYAHS